MNLSFETSTSRCISCELQVFGINGIPMLAIGWSNLKFLVKIKGAYGIIFVEVMYFIGLSFQSYGLRFSYPAFYLKYK